MYAAVLRIPNSGRDCLTHELHFRHHGGLFPNSVGSVSKLLGKMSQHIQPIPPHNTNFSKVVCHISQVIVTTSKISARIFSSPWDNVQTHGGRAQAHVSHVQTERGHFQTSSGNFQHPLRNFQTPPGNYQMHWSLEPFRPCGLGPRVLTNLFANEKIQSSGSRERA